MPDVILDRVGSSEIIDRTVDTYGLGAGADPSKAAARQDAAIAGVRSRLHVLRTPVQGVWRLTYTSERPTLTALILSDLLEGVQASQAAAADRARQPWSLLQDAARRNTADVSEGLIMINAAQASVGAHQVEDRRPPDARFRGSLKVAAAGADEGRGMDAGLDQLRAEKAALAAKQTQLSQRYGLRHPEMVAVLAQIRRIDALIDARTRLEATSDSLAEGAAARDRDRQALRQESQIVADLISTQTSLLDQLARRLQSVQHQNAVIANQTARLAPPAPLQIKPLTRPAPLQHPDPSPLRRIALVSELTTAALMCVALMVLARERRLLTTAADVQRLFGLPVAAVVPDVSAGRRSMGRSVQAVQPTDLLLRGDATPFGDAFLALQRELGVSSTMEASRVIAICSGLPNEGKTTTSTGLARSAALSGRRVVLVDCDGRRRALSRALSVTAAPGLVEVLGGRVALNDALIPDEGSGLRLIAHSATDAVEDLSDPVRLASLLVRLRDLFDVIVLDTGPVLALTEARVVAALADQVVFVARWRRTPVKAAQIALKMLHSAGVKVEGVVLTMADLRAMARMGGASAPKLWRPGLASQAEAQR